VRSQALGARRGVIVEMIRHERKNLHFADHRRILARFAHRSHKSDLHTFFRDHPSICFIYGWLRSQFSAVSELVGLAATRAKPGGQAA
jgi:hypothetical protein